MKFQIKAAKFYQIYCMWLREINLEQGQICFTSYASSAGFQILPYFKSSTAMDKIIIVQYISLSVIRALAYKVFSRISDLTQWSRFLYGKAQLKINAWVFNPKQSSYKNANANVVLFLCLCVRDRMRTPSVNAKLLDWLVKIIWAPHEPMNSHTPSVLLW